MKLYTNAASREICLDVPQKLEIELPCYLDIPLLGLYIQCLRQRTTLDAHQHVGK